MQAEQPASPGLGSGPRIVRGPPVRSVNRKIDPEPGGGFDEHCAVGGKYTKNSLISFRSENKRIFSSVLAETAQPLFGFVRPGQGGSRGGGRVRKKKLRLFVADQCGRSTLKSRKHGWCYRGF